ncbi:MAG: pyridoxal 5'-phosphate synthase glutaminase subunit PdxT [Bacteroidales bacterium]|nr:pyridoxal 5'-phosphate synthase glutaminase subunit PdxT [Bacteroidales bacterium]
MRIGILALQGAFIEHKHVLDSLHVESFEIRRLRDIESPFDGLIIPGGESTTMGKLLVELGLLEPLKQKIENGLPVFGTCAGAILLAKDIEGAAQGQGTTFATMDITIQRNAYGRQLGSFFTEEKFNDTVIPMSFIRAPIITKVNNGEVLATVNGDIVAARQGNQLATTFHPELKTDFVHRYFLGMM